MSKSPSAGSCEAKSSMQTVAGCVIYYTEHMAFKSLQVKTAQDSSVHVL